MTQKSWINLFLLEMQMNSFQLCLKINNCTKYIIEETSEFNTFPGGFIPGLSSYFWWLKFFIHFNC